MKKTFSFDAETDGLWGNPFAIAAIVYELLDVPAQDNRPAYSEWRMSAKFEARLPESVVSNDWVRENVLPAIADMPVTHKSYEEMLRDFAAFYMMHKEGADCVCHMGYIVEAHLLREMRRLGFIGDWDAPFPLYDVSGNLQAAGEDATSVDEYVKKKCIPVTQYGSTHHPLYDCEAAAKAYIALMRSRQ